MNLPNKLITAYATNVQTLVTQIKWNEPKLSIISTAMVGEAKYNLAQFEKLRTYH